MPFVVFPLPLAVMKGACDYARETILGMDL